MTLQSYSYLHCMGKFLWQKSSFGVGFIDKYQEGSVSDSFFFRKNMARKFDSFALNDYLCLSKYLKKPFLYEEEQYNEDSAGGRVCHAVLARLRTEAS